MKAHPERLSLSRAIGSEGCDYCTSSDTIIYSDVISSDTFTGNGWYGFYVAEEATVTTVTFRDRGGDVLTRPTTITWKDVALPAGCWIPAGRITQEDAYIDTFAISAGKVILYKD